MSIEWTEARSYTDIMYEKAEGIAKLTINRPEVHNAFRPETLSELIDAFADCR
ncbi:MAG TPA: enoyl-CoA hydratase-related protein, partial [Ktedonobacteraceae bacterium]|nr:enoyl-CoA hydratase-related protein [Ktedonobacteraceae bacterium]